MQAVCRWIAGRYSTDKAKRGISKEQIASDTRLSDTGVLGVKDRGVSLCFVAFRFVWQAGSRYGGGRRKCPQLLGHERVMQVMRNSSPTRLVVEGGGGRKSKEGGGWQADDRTSRDC